MVNLAQSWSQTYSEVNPRVSIAVTGGGSGIGIASLVDGTAQLVTSSRPMRAEEKAAVEKRRGERPVERVVGFDALAIVVHPSNPLSRMALSQLKCIYGEKGECRRWTDILPSGAPACRSNQIVAINRQSSSGTYQYFREVVIGNHEEVRLGTVDVNGSAEVVRLVSELPCAIGYVGMGYLDPSVRSLCLAASKGGACVLPSAANLRNRRYPLARRLFLYTMKSVSPELGDFLEWIEGRQGQSIVGGLGYIPAHPTGEAR